jgi:hypothetical protein
LVSLIIQIFVHNVQNSIYLLTLPNVACKKPVIPLVSVQFIENIMEQNPVGFPNSMYLHVGPYTPYFAYGYGGIRSAPTIWPLMSNPLTNPMAPKLVLGIAQTKIITNCREPSDENNDYSQKNTTLGCHESFLLENRTMNKNADLL